jgi:hypothetical protein
MTGDEWVAAEGSMDTQAWVASLAAKGGVLVAALDPDPSTGEPHPMVDGIGRDLPLILRSRDGASWHRQFLPVPAGEAGRVDAVFLVDGTMWASGATIDGSGTSKAAAWTTTDGITWTLLTTETGWDRIIAVTADEHGPVAITECGVWVRPDGGGVWRAPRRRGSCDRISSTQQFGRTWFAIGQSGQAVWAEHLGPFRDLLDVDLDDEHRLNRLVRAGGLLFALGRSWTAPLWCTPVVLDSDGQPAACSASGSETVPS